MFKKKKKSGLFNNLQFDATVNNNNDNNQFLLNFFNCSHSTTGEEVITRVALENRQAGRDREEIKLDDLQETLTQTLYNSTTSKWC